MCVHSFLCAQMYVRIIYTPTYQFLFFLNLCIILCVHTSFVYIHLCEEIHIYIHIYIYKNMYIVYMYSLLCTYICGKRQKAVYLTTFVVCVVLHLSQHTHTHTHTVPIDYGVATVSRIDWAMSLFCRILSLIGLFFKRDL